MGIDDFPDQTALRIAHFQMQPASDDLVNRIDQRVENGGLYWVLLYPENENDPFPVLCDSVDKHFFGVATDAETARQLRDLENKEVWITVVVNIIKFGKDSWPELTVYRQDLNNWARTSVRFAQD